MNKTELVERIAEETDLGKGEAQHYLDTTLQVIAESLKEGEEVQISGFGKFYVRESAPREGRNPQTGEKMTIQASRTPAFSAGKSFKDVIL